MTPLAWIGFGVLIAVAFFLVLFAVLNSGDQTHTESTDKMRDVNERLHELRRETRDYRKTHPQKRAESLLKERQRRVRRS